MTTLRLASLWTSACLSMTIVTGSGPQSKVMVPPLATAFRNAAAVQLAGVPCPTTCLVGARCSTGAAAYDGTGVSSAAVRLPSRTIESMPRTPQP